MNELDRILRRARKVAPHLSDETLLLLVNLFGWHEELVPMLSPETNDASASTGYMDTWLQAGVSRF